MARIRPFHGVRYDTERTGELGKLIAPPYDQINAAQAPRLLAAHPRNAVQLIWTGDQTRAAPISVTRPAPTWQGQSEFGPYEDAARRLRSWLEDGTLIRDEQPAIYAYSQRYSTVTGEEKTQLGFIAAVELSPYGESVFPHEATHDAVIADRLELLRATRASLSPIFGLYSDPQHTVLSFIRDTMPDGAASARVASDPDGAGGTPYWHWIDADQIEHTLWIIRDPRIVSTVAAAMADKDIIIADGHHRYETALRYQREQRALGDDDGQDDHALMFLSEIEEGGLSVLPIHRLLGGLDTTAIQALLRSLKEQAEVERLAHVGLVADAVQVSSETDHVAIGLVIRGSAHVVRVPRESGRRPADPEPSETGAEVFARLVLETGLGWNREEAIRSGRLAYATEWRQAIASVFMDHYQAACLLPPTPVTQVASWALAGRTMPPKSTFFYPKVPTGLVFHLHDTLA